MKKSEAAAARDEQLKSLDLEKRRQLRNLKKALICKREFWKQEIERHAFDSLEIRPATDKRRAGVVYFVRLELPRKRDPLFLAVSKAFAALANDISQLAPRKNPMKQELWLPSVMFSAGPIQPVIYKSRSVMSITKAQARSFQTKYAQAGMLPHGPFYLARPPVFDYRLRIQDRPVSGRSTFVHLNRPEWSVCFVPGTTTEIIVLPKRFVSQKPLARRKRLAGKKLSLMKKVGGTALYCVASGDEET